METSKPSIWNQIKDILVSDIYYLLVILGYIGTLFMTGFRPGVFASVLLAAVFVQLLLYKRIVLNKTMDYLVVAYFAYNLLSVIWLLKGGFPLSVFMQEFSNSILPIVFYFAGKSAKEKINRYYRLFMIGLLVLFVTGLVLYIAAPQFYLDYLVRWSLISKADVPTMRIRMHAVVGCTLLGSLSVVGMLVSARIMILEQKILSGGSLFVISMAFAFFSNQRSAMVVAILVLLYINYLVFFSLKLFDRKYFYIECIVIAVVFVLLLVGFHGVFMKIFYRLVSLPGAVSQRSEQWVAAVNNMYSSFLGNGLGANGHKALGIEGAHVIADGGLVKLFCEEGILGFSIFIYMMILLYKDSRQYIKEGFAELGVIAIILLQSVGSNILCFQLGAPIFWFAVGRCAYLLYESKKE